MPNSSSRSTTSWTPLIKQNGTVNGTVEVPRQGRRQVARRARHRRQPDQGAVLAHRPDEAARRHRRAGDVSGRRAAQGRRLDLDTFLKAAEACHKAGVPFGIGLGETTDNVDTAGAFFQAFGAAAGRRQGQHHGQDRHRAPGARILQEAGAVPAAGCAGLGRRLQQQVAGLRQGRADHEPAERLGGRQARRAAGRRAVLDARLPVGPEGPLRAVPALLLGHLELQQEQVGGQEPAASICRSRDAVEKMVAASGGYDLPAFEKLHRPSRPGPRKGRRRARSTTTRTRTTTRSCRSRRRRRRRRSPSRSTRRPSRPR